MEVAFELVMDRARRFAACVMLAFAGCVVVLWLVPGLLTKCLVSMGLLTAGVVTGLIWELCARRHRRSNASAAASPNDEPAPD